MKDPIFEEFMHRAQEMEQAAGPPPTKDPKKDKKITQAEAIKEFNSAQNPFRYYQNSDFDRGVRKALEKNKPNRNQQRTNSYENSHRSLN